MAQSPVVTDDVVVALDYTLRVDGKVVETSDDGAPIEFLQGAGEIVDGLEEALYGMSIGERKLVVVSPEDGYGEVDPEAYSDVPIEEFPEDIPLEPGVELNIEDESGESVDAMIDSVDGGMVRLSFNHPLAGKELHFEVAIAGLRPATEEELEHGHAHGPDGGH